MEGRAQREATRDGFFGQTVEWIVVENAVVRLSISRFVPEICAIFYLLS